MNAGLLAFIGFQLAFVVVGLSSVQKRRRTPGDYLVAGRSLGPWATGLSAVSTCCSGFMFIGLMGMVYQKGVVALWLVPGAVLGNWAVWRYFVPALRQRSARLDSLTIPEYLSGDSIVARRIIAVAILGFLGIYAGAQLNAGSKALSVLFGMNLSIGAFLGAAMIGLYCVAGGLRASVWTDVAQSIVMWIAMAVLLGLCLQRLGGVSGLLDTLRDKDPALVEWTGGGPLLAMNWIFIGLGLLGQPQVMVRGMALAGGREAAVARRVYTSYYATFMGMAVIVGLCCRALLSASEIADPELALPLLADQYASPLLLGLVLAGTFSASISTADSQVLACSAALSQDLTTRWRTSYLASKVATILVTGVALALALTASQDVYAVILMAWSLLAASLAPLMAFRTLGIGLRPGAATLMVCAGALTALSWRWAGIPFGVSEILPGAAAGLLVGAAMRASSSGARDRGPQPGG